jgi:hypothetical protein
VVNKLVSISLCVLLVFASGAVLAEATAAQTNMQIMLDKVKADKKLVVAANMNLSDKEAAVFWPIYDEYQNDLMALNQRLATAIKTYAQGYNNDSITDDAANKLVSDVLAIDTDEAAMRTKYAAKLQKVLPGKQVMRYMQIESKIRAGTRYQLADGIPLVVTDSPKQ